MNYRKLGNTGIEVSEIGFGTWGLGGDAYGPTEDSDSITALRSAFDLGITFYDTSDLYGDGRSEKVLGEAVADFRDQVIITSKVGLLPHDGFDMPCDFSREHIRNGIEGSLRRLKMNYLDVYLLHSPEVHHIEDTPEAVETMKELKHEGKIRAWGVSARSPRDALTMIERFGADVVQVNYNIIDQRCEDDGLFDLAREHKTGIIARTPLAFGYLTGHIRGETTFLGKDHRENWPAEQLAIWANAPGLFSHLYDSDDRTAAQFALQFCLAGDLVSTVIPGMMTPDQVMEDVYASDLTPLSVKELAEIRRIYDSNTFYDKTSKLRSKR